MRKNFLSFNMQLFLTYIVLVIVPILIAGFVFAQNSVRNSQADQLLFMEKYNQTTMGSVEYILSQADKIVSMQFIDEEVLAAVAKDSDPHSMEYVHNMKIIENAIKNAYHYNLDIRSVYLENTTHQYYELSYSLFSRDYIKENLWSWGEAAENMPGRRNVILWRDKAGELQTVLLVHTLKDINRNRELGYLCVEVSFNAIQELLKEHKAENEYMLLLDEKGETLYDSTQQADSRTSQELFERAADLVEEASTGEGGSASGYITMGGASYTASVIKSGELGWVLMYCAPSAVLSVSENATLLPYLVIFLGAIILDLLIALFFSRRLTKSISNLCVVIDNCKDGDIRTVEIHDSLFENEIQVLLRSYNQMAARLSVSAEKEYQRKLHEKLMGMKMLQAQINPHFLYNTLNVISSIANIHQIDSIQTVSTNIASMLRYSIKAPAMVTIEGELTQIRHYIDIQKVRFPGKILLNIEAAPELMAVPCPVFILQPLVENAVIHGIEPTGRAGIIQIYCYEKEDGVYLSVRDNGVGMSPGQLDRLMSTFVQDVAVGTGGNSIGLCNVHQRIGLYYGEGHGLAIESGEGEGTTVTIHISKSPPADYPGQPK